jgi:thiol-disulfide isomerase/thioredoxin
MTPTVKNRLVFIASLALVLGVAGLIFFIRASRVPSQCVEVTTSNFQAEVLDSKLPVFMEFYVTEDCEPCEKQYPIVEKLAQEYKGKVKFVRIEAAKQAGISKALGVEKVPTHVLFNPATMDGMMKTGLTDEAKLRKFIDEFLAAMPPPATNPPATNPPATNPPATNPPATNPPATSPPATNPPATNPPATNPPATSPPATSPPATNPPATNPPATDPSSKPKDTKPSTVRPTT